METVLAYYSKSQGMTNTLTFALGLNLPTEQLNILKDICHQKERVSSVCGRQVWAKHVSKGCLQWDPCAQAERGAEAGSLPQFQPAETGGRNQAVPLKSHQLPFRKLWSQQTPRAAQPGGASSSTQPFLPALRQHGLQVWNVVVHALEGSEGFTTLPWMLICSCYTVQRQRCM